VDFATSLADWVEPYHEHIRPLHATAPTETSKPVSHPVKNSNPRVQNGTNGQGKKEEEAPPFKEPPPLVSSFFEGMSGKMCPYHGVLTTILFRHAKSVQGCSKRRGGFHYPTCGKPYARGTSVGRLMFAATLI
jgi:hypothetical protein